MGSFYFSINVRAMSAICANRISGSPYLNFLCIVL